MSDPQELELQLDVSRHHVGAGIKSGTSGRASAFLTTKQCLQPHGDISYSLFLCPGISGLGLILSGTRKIEKSPVGRLCHAPVLAFPGPL